MALKPAIQMPLKLIEVWTLIMYGICNTCSVNWGVSAYKFAASEMAWPVYLKQFLALMMFKLPRQNYFQFEWEVYSNQA